jgi:hypothetical protein
MEESVTRKPEYASVFAFVVEVWTIVTTLASVALMKFLVS